MPKRVKIITDFREFPESILSDTVTLIINSLKINKDDFTELPVDVGTLKSQLKKFNKKRTTIAYHGQSTDTRKARKAMQTSLSAIGTWINVSARGNASLLHKSGFPFHQKSKAQGILPRTILTLTPLNGKGKLKFAISRINIQFVRYGMMYTLADNPEKDPSKWTFYYCSKKDGITTGLESGKDYKFVSFGMGTDKRLVYSNPVTMSAQ